MAEQLLQAGLNALKGYVALHVLTCLVPAFLLAGAIVSFVSRETIIGYLGSAASKIKSFVIAGGVCHWHRASCLSIWYASIRWRGQGFHLAKRGQPR
ncbi:MAG: permease [Dehalococcoidia bacterium]|nr:permease [Dehalococcoidia bacterium]